MVFDGAVNAYRVSPTLVRMGRREWVTEDGWREALDEGFRTVVDLRSDFEFSVRRMGDAEVGPEVLAELTVVHCPTEDPEHPGFNYVMGYLDHPNGYLGYMDLFGDRVARAVLAMAHADGPVIVHCSAGRDRTGLVLSLGQLIAGWDHERIVEGYVRAAEGINAFQEHNPHPKETFKRGAEWDAWLQERVDALRVFLREVDAEGFLRSQGAGDGDLAAV
ncbi:MAG: tyrosine-protein phosphatase, partial [Propionibacteriaceae bacterium]|nr:tyrosine-protein phosphatase [Propionibacteriaceae bacterium]